MQNAIGFRVLPWLDSTLILRVQERSGEGLSPQKSCAGSDHTFATKKQYDSVLRLEIERMEMTVAGETK